MADDITLTVRVRDLTRGDFNRLDHQLDRMRRDLRGVSRDTDSAGMHSRRLGQDINQLQQRFQRMQTTGSLTRRELTQMRGQLDAMGRSALNAARSGEITHDRFHSLNSEIGSMRAQLARLDEGLNNNTNALRRNNSQTRTTVRMVNGVTQSIRTATRSTDGNTNVINTWRRSANTAGNTMRRLGTNGSFAGGVFSNMRSKLIGLAVVLIASVLPTLGALAPMLAGIAAIVGTVALAFSGLSKPTRMLGKDEKEFLKGLSPLKREFEALQKTARKAVLPGLTKSFKDVGNAVKGMNPVIKIAGEHFSTLVGKIAKGVGNKDFMKSFTENVRIGSDWVIKFTGSFGKFLKEFLDFGTKSKPALDAWQSLLGGFLDTGLPNMFKEMERGIKGSSTYLTGFADFLNGKLLPVLGRVIAAFMDAFGPLLAQVLRTAGNLLDVFGTVFAGVMEGLKPGISLVTDVFAGLNEMFEIAIGTVGNLAKALGTVLFGALADLAGENRFTAMKDDFTGFSDWVKTNQSSIRATFDAVALAIIDMVDTGVGMLPLLANAFKLMVDAALIAVGAMITGLATAFGHLPGMGWLKDAKKNFDEFAAGVNEKFDKAAGAAEKFATSVSKRSARAKFVFKVDEAKANLDYIKGQLNDKSLSKPRRAHLEVEKKQAEQKLAEARRELRSFDRKRAIATVEANNAPFFGKIRQARMARIPRKSVTITANPGSFWERVRSLTGRVLGTSYINVQMRKVEAQNAPRFSAHGNIFRSFADGGMEDHRAQIADGGPTRIWNEPETGGESYIPLGPSKRTRSRQIATTTVGILGGSVQWFAKGGLTKKQKAQADAERQARSEARGELTISHFGRMAGYKNDEFKKALGLPEALGSLVSSLNHWRSVILKATHGGVERSLLKQLDRAGKSLIKYEKSLSKVEKSLDKAKTKLDDLKSAASQLRESVTSGVMSATNITRNTSEDKNLTVADLMTTMTQGRDKATAFSDALARLKKKGVAKEIIQQIAEAGIEGGGLQTAGTLLTASESEIASLNSLQKQINEAAKSSGKTAADAMYAAGIKAAEGLVKGLEKKQKDIEKAMMRIAKSMEKAIKKALGIHSPSKVMQEVGHLTAEGYAIGIQKNRRVNSAWESMLTTKSTGPRSGGGAMYGGGGEPMILRVQIGDRVLDEIMLDSARRVVRTRGGNVQAVLGPPGRRTG
jgi:predicted  nucleic acid-binding Zn-ribbon protein